ncbi:MAG: DUF2934 domain-containing protein, partial [Treponema sp.]|nr:DUF2934 domain-containing protein [Treponema sp.]
QPAAAPVVVPAAVPVEYVTVYINLDDEIRFRAFELYQRRGGQNGDAEGDWHMAVIDVCGRYEATGHRSDILDGYWHAIKTTEK